MATIIEEDPDRRTPFEILASAVLRCGPMPKHVAFIMDGNRRYAKSLGEPIVKGHEKGSEVFGNVLSWAVALRIPMVTVYAFSIENFKRSHKEIEDLFALLARTIDMLDNPENQKKYFAGKDRIRVQIIGNWDLIPEHLKPIVGRLHMHSLEISEPVLTVNIAFAYTSRDAIFRSHKAIVEGHQFLTPSDVTERLFEELHSIFPVPPIDLFIRTGGDTRLSDFMLWEATYAHIEFLEGTWPDFKFWDFWKAIFRFQAAPKVQEPQREDRTLTRKQEKFIAMHRDKMLNEMKLAADRYVEPEETGYIGVMRRPWLKKMFTDFIDFDF